MHIPFFNIITYFFNIVKPVGPHFTGKYNAYGRPLEVAKKSHMVGPVGNTELGSRWRRVDHLQVAYEFRENLRPYRAARSRKNFAYGGVTVGNSGRDSRPRPAELVLTNRTAKEKRGAVSRLS